jgi:ribonuclease P/MRP protein subunit POP5
MREKKRYLAFEVVTESGDPVDRKGLLDEIYFATQTLIGDAGSSEIGYRLMDFSGSRGIMRVNHGAVELARAAMATVYVIKGTRAYINILGVSGTIRAATEKYIVTENVASTNILSIQVRNGRMSGIAVREKGDEIDIVPDDREVLKRGNTRYLSLTSTDTVINYKE